MAWYSCWCYKGHTTDMYQRHAFDRLQICLLALVLHISSRQISNVFSFSKCHLQFHEILLYRNICLKILKESPISWRFHCRERFVLKARFSTDRQQMNKTYEQKNAYWQKKLLCWILRGKIWATKNT